MREHGAKHRVPESTQLVGFGHFGAPRAASLVAASVGGLLFGVTHAARHPSAWRSGSPPDHDAEQSMHVSSTHTVAGGPSYSSHRVRTQNMVSAARNFSHRSRSSSRCRRTHS